MTTLIIYSHPNKEGHCGYFLKKTIKKLKEKKEKYEILDLYKMKFNPVLNEYEHYTSGNKKISKETLEIQKKITKTNNLIFIYPCWWNNVPAILKGFFDKILLPNFAFKYINNLPYGMLKNKKAIIFSSTGTPRIYSVLIMRNSFIKIVSKNTLNFCGIKTKSYLIYSASKLTNKNKEKIDGLVKKGINWII